MLALLTQVQGRIGRGTTTFSDTDTYSSRYYFEEAEATVACRQLGNKLGYTLVSASKVPAEETDDGPSSYSYNAVSCVGSESTLQSCPTYSWVGSNSASVHTFDVGVSCTFLAPGSACSECPAGKISGTTGIERCQDCPAGTSSAAGSWKCQSCETGWASVAGGLCTECADAVGGICPTVFVDTSEVRWAVDGADEIINWRAENVTLTQTWDVDGWLIEKPRSLQCSDAVTKCTIDAQATGDSDNMRRVLRLEYAGPVFLSRLIIKGGYLDSNGGGISVLHSTVHLTNCDILDNYGWVGGIYISRSSMNLDGCKISGNSALSHGGLFASYSEVDLTSCEISDNSCTATSSSSAGGIRTVNTIMTMKYCVITGNSANGVYARGNTYVYGTRFASNDGTYDLYGSYSYSIVVYSTCPFEGYNEDATSLGSATFYAVAGSHTSYTCTLCVPGTSRSESEADCTVRYWLGALGDWVDVTA